LNDKGTIAGAPEPAWSAVAGIAVGKGAKNKLAGDKGALGGVRLSLDGQGSVDKFELCAAGRFEFLCKGLHNGDFSRPNKPAFASLLCPAFRHPSKPRIASWRYYAMTP
jgi:hypothetical protein